MKARIVYVKEGVETLIEILDLSFINFCKDLFRRKIYLTSSKIGKTLSIAINTDNILFVEEIR